MKIFKALFIFIASLILLTYGFSLFLGIPQFELQKDLIFSTALFMAGFVELFIVLALAGYLGF